MLKLRDAVPADVALMLDYIRELAEYERAPEKAIARAEDLARHVFGEREAILTTRDAETFSAPDCLTVVGWYRRALEMCGAREPRVIEEECRAAGGACCRYRLRWS